jgi:hypothetical protein
MRAKAEAMISRPTGANEIHAPSALQCGMFILGLKITLKIAGFATTMRWILRGIEHARPESCLSSEALAPTLRAVALAGALFPGRALCLEQSLTAYYYLRRAGADVYLRLGVKPHPFEAHAWVEHGGEPINDVPERVKHFVPFPGLFL